MSQAIITEYLGPGVTLGARIRAKCYSGNITYPCPPGLNEEDCHRAAARAFMKEMGWTGKLVAGSMPDGSGYAFVFLPEEK
jgi:hypothetical protein